MAAVSGIFAMIFMLFFESILTVHLIMDLDVGEDSAGNIKFDQICLGYFFALICATYALSSPFVYILTALIPRRWLTFMSFLVAALALLLLGPS